MDLRTKGKMKEEQGCFAFKSQLRLHMGRTYQGCEYAECKGWIEREREKGCFKDAPLSRFKSSFQN